MSLGRKAPSAATLRAVGFAVRGGALAALLFAVAVGLRAQPAADIRPAVIPVKAERPVAPAPTLADVPYGPHARNVLDFWRAASERPTPVVIYIHGGGFTEGDKSGARKERLVQACLDAGVSFAAINYRYLSPQSPMPAVLRDCARAVQFIRAHAAEWGVDKARVAAYGGSAGAGVSLWLAFHDDLAEPGAADPVRRESTRLTCAGAHSPQFSYDPLRWGALLGDEAVARFGKAYESPVLYGFATAEELRGPAGAKVRADCDMLGLISRDDPPVFLETGARGLALTTVNQLLHHPKHAQALYARCRELGVPVVASIPDFGIAPPADGPATLREFLFHHLNVR
jgi:acetyl esterase/lipase